MYGSPEQGAYLLRQLPHLCGSDPQSFSRFDPLSPNHPLTGRNDEAKQNTTNDLQWRVTNYLAQIAFIDGMATQ